MMWTPLWFVVVFSLDNERQVNIQNIILLCLYSQISIQLVYQAFTFVKFHAKHIHVYDGMAIPYTEDHKNISNLHIIACHFSGELATLKLVDLSHNQLVTVPDNLGIGQLLDHLSLGHNKLTELPTDLRKFRTLDHLDISHNQIGAIAKVFHTVLTQLRVGAMAEI